jgi:hypothetical protein
MPIANVIARAVVLAGLAAAIVSTLVQVLLWGIFTDALPGILWRDARLAAALVLGREVLAPASTFDAPVMLVATLVHFALSIVFAAVLAAVIARRPMAFALVTGAMFGGVLYAIDLHALTAFFPWFVVARGPITLAAHVAFGITAAVVYRAMTAGRARR